MLQRAVGLGDVRERVSPLCTARPVLNQLQNLAPHIRIHRLPSTSTVPIPIPAPTSRLEQAHQIVHEFAARDLLHEVAASILHARVREVERSKLDVGIFVAYSALQTAHRLFGLHRLAADDVGDLQVECDVFEGGAGGALDLSIELAVRRAEPRRHAGGDGSSF